MLLCWRGMGPHTAVYPLVSYRGEMTITKIKTRGYRGQATQFQYMPPGELVVADKTCVGKMTVTQELADYLVGIGIGQVVEDILEAPNPDIRSTPEFAVAVEMPEFSVVANDFELSGVHLNYPDLSVMSRADLIEFAARHDIELPGGYLTKDKLIAFITATNE